jgi:hypothetical protein
MTSSVETSKGFPYSEVDGGIQGAYLLGHKFGVQLGESAWFIGTYEPTLGLENFDWGDDGSAPVHGSRQFVRATTWSTVVKIVDAIQEHLDV